MGHEALADRKYRRAIGLFSESLAIYPDQPKVYQQLETAKTMLKQIYVYEIYELVDEREKQPIADFLSAWKMCADLPELGVVKARVSSIRVDLDKRFGRAEKRLHTSTEPHKYYAHLSKMSKLMATERVEQAESRIADELEKKHLEAQREADAAKRPGEALLHTAAAATFAPGDTGLWAEFTKRRAALVDKLAIPLSVGATSTAGAAHSRALLGGLKRRLPRIFQVTRGADLALELRGTKPQPAENRVSDRRSARCQVGTRREKNPKCDPLRRRAAAAHRSYEAQLQALDRAREGCGSAANPSACNNQLAGEARELRRAQKHYETLEREVGRCPEFIERPIYKMFFYKRFTVMRRVDAVGTVTLARSGQVQKSRSVRGTASAKDSFGQGLSCANIAADPLDLASLASLAAAAREQMLDRSLTELLRLRRRLAREQLAGKDAGDGRLDALVRALVVDESDKEIAEQLEARLAGMWTTDFGLTARIRR